MLILTLSSPTISPTFKSSVLKNIGKDLEGQTLEPLKSVKDHMSLSYTEYYPSQTKWVSEAHERT